MNLGERKVIPFPGTMPRPFLDDRFFGDQTLLARFGHPRNWCSSRGPNVYARLECTHGCDFFLPAYDQVDGWYWKMMRSEPRCGGMD